MNSRKPEILRFDGFLLSKSYKFSTKKVQKSSLSWHWRVIQSLKKKRNCGLTYEVKNLVNFDPTTQKSENFFLMGSLVQSIQGLSYKNT